MKKCVSATIIIMMICLCLCFKGNPFFCLAERREEESVYQILDENFIEVNSSYDVVVGDMFISEDNMLYEIYEIDEKFLIAYARRVEKVDLPKVEEPNKISQIKTYDKKIGMYHTHNDESYVIGDGYDSVYGEGGIMDIGDAFARELKKFNIQVYENDTLHLPHNSTAYARSKVTAQKLLNSVSLDAIFDVHRDGVPRKQFVGEVKGREMSKIRIVIGKSNSNYAQNLQFAKEIKAYADKNYPGLIKDIYMGSGNYNQNLSKTALLFEMGTYLIEKDYVYSALPYLADTIDKVIYTDAVSSTENEKQNEDNNKNEPLENNNSEIPNNSTNQESVENVIEDKKTENINTSTKSVFIAIFLLSVVGGGILLFLINLREIKKKRKK